MCIIDSPNTFASVKTHIKNLKMKKLFILLLLVLPTVQLLCKSLENETNFVATNKTVSIQVNAPDGWTPVAGSVLQHQYLKGTASFMIKNESLLNNKTVPEAVAIAKSQIEKYFKQTAFEETVPCSVDGYKGEKLTFSYGISVGGMLLKMKMSNIYIMVENQCYVISVGDMENKYPELSSELPTILSSIKIVTN
jgi:hypothetical protein